MKKFSTAYSREKVIEPFIVKGDSMTHQDQKLSCDLSTIVQQWNPSVAEQTQTLAQIAQSMKFDDVSSATDFHGALDAFLHIDETFASFPSSVREQFNNDPGEFFNFYDDPANRTELIKMGLIEPTKAEAKQLKSEERKAERQAMAQTVSNAVRQASQNEGENPS